VAQRWGELCPVCGRAPRAWLVIGLLLRPRAPHLAGSPAQLFLLERELPSPFDGPPSSGATPCVLVGTWHQGSPVRLFRVNRVYARSSPGRSQLSAHQGARRPQSWVRHTHRKAFLEGSPRRQINFSACDCK
jgi:hypothetical protein